MPAIVNEGLLDARLSAMEAARSWSPRLVSRLESMIRSAPDEQLHRISPFEFAAQRGIGEAEAIDLLLHGVKVGLFTIEWHLVCPACFTLVQSLGSLREVHATFRCMNCKADREVCLDDYIQVAFTVAPSVRRLAQHDPLSLSARDYVFGCGFPRGVRLPDGTPWLDVVAGITPALEWVEPGERRELDIAVSPGVLSGCDVVTHAEFLLPVQDGPEGPPARREIALCDRRFQGDLAALAPGRCVLAIENRSEARAAIVVFQFPPVFDRPELIQPPTLTGKRLLLTQTFRELFPSETIRNASGLGVRRVALLFTDLKGSTELYDRLGDLRAFNLVEQHFERLGRVVRAHGGTVVKTIGDAVMASFPEPAAAVAAAIEMLRVIEAFNDEHGARDVVLKVGVHAGASIAVTLNERLDWFGQTVNIAARVQGLADAGEIYITDEAHDAPGVADLLRGLEVERRDARLKGIRRSMTVHRIAIPAATGA